MTDFTLRPGVEAPEVDAYNEHVEANGDREVDTPLHVLHHGVSGRIGVTRLADAAIVALYERLNRLDSFDGHLEWLHEHYPETVFDGSSGDLGAVNVVLSRKLLEAEVRVADLYERLRVEHAEHPEPHYWDDRSFCDACHAEIEEGVTGLWYWHWHPTRDGRGGWYCADCGRLYGTINQDDVPDPCTCSDCREIDTRRVASSDAFCEALKSAKTPLLERVKSLEQARAHVAELDRALEHALSQWRWDNDEQRMVLVNDPKEAAVTLLEALAPPTRRRTMSSINAQIDAAVVLMKERAAEFDDSRGMGEDETARVLAARAKSNVIRAVGILFDAAWRRTDKPANESDAIVHLVDCMNLCALAVGHLHEAERGDR
jgi:hypothetical protein